MTRLSNIPALTAALTPALLAATLLSLAASGCTARTGLTTGGSDTDDDASDADADAGTSSSASGPSDTAESADASDEGDASSDDATSGEPPHDGPGEGELCDFWAQDCAPGQKCGPVGLSVHRCVIAGTEPPDAPCTMLDGIEPYAGADTCDDTATCFAIDKQTGEGRCVEMCVGSPNNSSCPQTGHDCIPINNGDIHVCPSPCDPLAADQCPPGQSCFGVYGGSDPDIDGFLCFQSTARDGGFSGDDCASVNNCADQHLCVGSEFYGPDCAHTSCCTEYCDLTDTTFTCAGADQECIALFPPDDPHYANVGACMVP